MEEEHTLCNRTANVHLVVDLSSHGGSSNKMTSNAPSKKCKISPACQVMLKRHNCKAISVPLGAYGALSETLGQSWCWRAFEIIQYCVYCLKQPFRNLLIVYLCIYVFLICLYMYIYNEPESKTTVKDSFSWSISGSVSPSIQRLHTFGTWGLFWTRCKGEGGASFWIYNIWITLARERLARLKSNLNLKLVRHYRDKQGRPKIQGGPHLTQSGEYPINLGLKASCLYSRYSS